MRETQSFVDLPDVSRETLDRLRWFEAEFLRWTARINLVSPKTLPAFWERHVIDSSQVFKYLKSEEQSLADLGSGGGLPGLVLAIFDKGSNGSRHFTLIDSDKRKAAFMSHVARFLDLNVSVEPSRIENLSPIKADVITSRALAPLSQLLALSEPHLGPNGRMIFLKGQNADQEINSALEAWRFSHQKHPSISQPDAFIVVISGPIERLSNS